MRTVMGNLHQVWAFPRQRCNTVFAGYWGWFALCRWLLGRQLWIDKRLSCNTLTLLLCPPPTEVYFEFCNGGDVGGIGCTGRAFAS